MVLACMIALLYSSGSIWEEEEDDASDDVLDDDSAAAATVGWVIETVTKPRMKPSHIHSDIITGSILLYRLEGKAEGRMVDMIAAAQPFQVCAHHYDTGSSVGGSMVLGGLGDRRQSISGKS